MLDRKTLIDEDKLQRLMNHETSELSVETNIVYPDIEQNRLTLFNFLLMTGYLNVVSKRQLFSSGVCYTLAIPNREIREVYTHEIIENDVLL